MPQEVPPARHDRCEGARTDGQAWDADTAVEQLYAVHYRRLVRLSVLLVGDVDTAEEVVQDCFVAMHGRWRSLREPDRALAYVRQSVVNRSRSALRRRGVAASYVARQAPLRAVPAGPPDASGLAHRSGQREVSVPGADHDAVAAERRSTVLDALRALPTRQREVLALRYYLDLSEADIADTLRISRGAVKSHSSRGIAALRTTWRQP